MRPLEEVLLRFSPCLAWASKKLRKFGLRGRVRLLPILGFGLCLGGRTPRRACNITLSTHRFSDWGLQGDLRKGLRGNKGQLRRGLTCFEGLRQTLRPLLFSLGALSSVDLPALATAEKV